MDPRSDLNDNELGANIGKRFANVSPAIMQSPLPRSTMELVELRVSQIKRLRLLLDARSSWERAGVSRGWRRGWSRADLVSAAGMPRSAVAQFEAGGTVPTSPRLGRIARALDADLTVRVEPRPHVA